MNNIKQINRTGHSHRIFAIVSILILSACANVIAPTESTSESKACVATGRWINPKTGVYISTSTITKNAARHDVVLLGEAHMNNDHHIWQLQTIAQIHSANPDIILGFEAFPREAQSVLDKWVGGDLSKKEFLKQSGWNDFWRFNPELYMALFNFARINRVPMVALNVNRSLINKVSANGWDSIKKSDRSGITNPATASAGYIKILEDVFKQHDDEKEKNNQLKKELAKKELAKKELAFDRFVDVQLTWDRAFAQAINDTIRSNTTAGRNPVMINIIGRGHIDYGFGVSHQLKSLGVNNIISLAPWDDFLHCDQMTNSSIAMADAVFGTAAKIEHDNNAKPKLGVFIEQGEGGVAVKKVAPESIAESAGIKSGDLLIEAAGKKLKEPSDLISTVSNILPGTWLPLKIMRNEKIIDIVAKFKR